MTDKILNLGLYQENEREIQIGEDKFKVKDLSTVQMMRLMHVSEMYKKVMEEMKVEDKFSAKLNKTANDLDGAMRELMIDLTGMSKEKAGKLSLKQIFQVMSFLNDSEQTESGFLEPEKNKKTE